jgi:hypothetical protein
VHSQERLRPAVVALRLVALLSVVPLQLVELRQQPAQWASASWQRRKAWRLARQLPGL